MYLPSAWPSFLWSACTNIQMLQQLFGIIKSTLMKMVVQPMEHLILNLHMQIVFW